jgi:hypothetical protein
MSHVNVRYPRMASLPFVPRYPCILDNAFQRHVKVRAKHAPAELAALEAGLPELGKQTPGPGLQSERIKTEGVSVLQRDKDYELLLNLPTKITE